MGHPVGRTVQRDEPGFFDELAFFFAAITRPRSGIHALARIMGTSVDTIERDYGTLLDGALESITGALDSLDNEADARADDV